MATVRGLIDTGCTHSKIPQNTVKRRDVNVLGATGTPLYITPMEELQSKKVARANLSFPGRSTTKMDWEIMVDELSEPQTTPFDGIV